MVDGRTVDALLDPGEVMAAVREAFELHAQRAGRVFPVIREHLKTGGVFGVKAGDVQHQSLLGLKAAGFWPANRQVGGEPHQATILLLDPATGRPQCIMDGNSITTARTGAAGALGLQLLARPESENLTLFGTGVQARSQLRYALRALPRLQRICYVPVDRKPRPDFESLFTDRCSIRCASDADAAVATSDVVITATTGGGPLFDLQAVRPGTHLNCVGTDTRGKRELPDGLLQEARRVVDDRLQACQLGELQWAPELSCTELGALFVGTQVFDRKATDITVFDMTGLALQDLTVARYVFRKASVSGVGSSIAWAW